ncbi:MAG TPA: FGGY family carbohydrate kinase [Acidimicrobiales bacterium]|nr:FGGY family carbohydrate kinase [Acidimicrobiales bacterium]
MDALGIDIGSTNVKVVLVRDDGTTLTAAHRPLTWFRDGPTAEQDGGAMWAAVRGALADAVAAVGPETVAAVGGIGLCGQYSSIVPVDAAGTPLAPMRLYLDQRGTPHCLDILGRHEEAFLTWLDRHPIPPVGGGLALGHLLAFQHDEPAVHERTAAYLEPVDYVTARLTGTIAATQGSMFASQLIDNRTLGATAYDAELVALAGIDPSRLPPLVEVGSVVGTVLPEVADGLGLPTGVPVITGMTDSCAGAHATGAEARGRVGIAIGTTGVVLSSVEALGVDLDHEVLAMPGLRTDRYLVSAENGIAGRAVEHVLAHLVHATDALGDHGAADPFAGFDAALDASPAGARGVRFLPWLSGSLSPQADAAMRGGFVGVSLDSQRVDLVRAAAEGVAHNLRWLLDPVEAFTGQRADEVVLTGGAARSAAWSQVLADVLQRPVHVLQEPGHSGARASAGWALEQLGHGGGEWVRLDRTFEPDPSTADVHAHAQGQFTSVFEALRPLGLGPVAPS